MKKLNPLDESEKYLFVGGRSQFPGHDAQTAREQFETEKKEVLSAYDGVRANIEIRVLRSHLLGLRRRLAKLAYHRAECATRKL